ncbi:hypothetical protein GCM10010464_58390 [Pseudonocardia yunnanensis]
MWQDRADSRLAGMGPIELLVIEFPGSRFTGGIMPELRRLVESRTITVIDGLLVSKDDEGKTSFTEFAELGAANDAAPLLEILDHAEGLVSDEDIAELTESLPPGDSAAILAFEHTWALPLRQAVVASGGVLAANLRIPGAVVEEVLATVPDQP